MSRGKDSALDVQNRLFKEFYCLALIRSGLMESDFKKNLPNLDRIRGAQVSHPEIGKEIGKFVLMQAGLSESKAENAGFKLLDLNYGDKEGWREWCDSSKIKVEDEGWVALKVSSAEDLKNYLKINNIKYDEGKLSYLSPMPSPNLPSMIINIRQLTDVVLDQYRQKVLSDITDAVISKVKEADRRHFHYSLSISCGNKEKQSYIFGELSELGIKESSIYIGNEKNITIQIDDENGKQKYIKKLESIGVWVVKGGDIPKIDVNEDDRELSITYKGDKQRDGILKVLNPRGDCFSHSKEKSCITIVRKSLKKEDYEGLVEDILGELKDARVLGRDEYLKWVARGDKEVVEGIMKTLKGNNGLPPPGPFSNAELRGSDKNKSGPAT